jgi:cell division protein FtsB
MGKSKYGKPGTGVTIIFQATPMRTLLVRLCYGLAIVVVASYVYVTLQGPRGLHALVEKRAAIAQMEKVNTRLTRENEQKRDYIHRLESDQGLQEKVIQEQMKLVHPEDHVFITGPPPPAAKQ